MDNERLIKLLASTEQFKNFGEFATDSGQAVRYLDNERKTAGESSTKSGSKLKDFVAGEETEDWVPEDAFKVAHEFRNKCAGQVSKSLMNQFLKDLNSIWRARENK